MITAHLKKLRLRNSISPQEERVIRGLVAENRRWPADSVLVRAGCSTAGWFAARTFRAATAR